MVLALKRIEVRSLFSLKKRASIGSRRWMLVHEITFKIVPRVNYNVHTFIHTWDECLRRLELVDRKRR